MIENNLPRAKTEKTYELSPSIRKIIAEMNSKSDGDIEPRLIKVYSGDHPKLRYTTLSGVKRLMLSPSEFEDGTKIREELKIMDGQYAEGRRVGHEYHTLEIFVVDHLSQEINEVEWSSPAPTVTVSNNMILIDGKISGKFQGGLIKEVQLKASVTIPNGPEGFTSLEDCVIIIGRDNSRNKGDTNIAREWDNKLYIPRIKKTIQKHYQEMLNVSNELLAQLTSKRQIKILSSEYEPKTLRVGDFYETYLLITDFVVNVSGANMNPIYKVMMNNFAVYKKVLRYYEKMTPHFAVVSQSLNVLIDQGRLLKDLTVLMDMTVSELLMAAKNGISQITSYALDGARMQADFKNCLVPHAMLVKMDRSLYARKIESFIKATSLIYPGDDIPVVNDGMPGLIKIKKHEKSDIIQYASRDPNSTHLGFCFEEIRENISELPKKNEVVNTSKLVTNASLRPLQFTESVKKIGLSSQLNLNRYMAIKIDGLVSERLNIREEDNCRVELRLHVGEYLFTKLSKTSNYMKNDPN